MENINPKIICHLKLLIHMHKMVNLIMQMTKSILTMSNLIMTHFYSLMMITSGQNKLMKTNMTLMIHVMIPLLKAVMSSIKILNCIISFANPLFHLKEVGRIDTSRHVPPRCTFSFDDSDYCRDISMFFNPCYESSLHHDNPVPDRRVPKGDFIYLMNS